MVLAPFSVSLATLAEDERITNANIQQGHVQEIPKIFPASFHIDNSVSWVWDFWSGRSSAALFSSERPITSGKEFLSLV
jgi:hypothetical protein